MRPTHSAPKDLIFGTRAIIETIQAGKSLDKILLQQGLPNPLHQSLIELARQHRVPIQKVPLAKLDRITRKNHQGVIAFGSPIDFADIRDVIQHIYEQGRAPFVVVLDGLTDVRNVGAIARSALGAGVDALVIPTKGIAAIREDAMKASAGALAHIAVCRTPNLVSTLQYLRDSGLQITACHEKTEQVLYTADLTGPLAIILGAEDEGISRACLALVNHSVKIPMQGPIASLNVAAAAAVVIYEVVRQRSIE